MENIELIEFCGIDRWKDAVENTGKYESWILANEDFDRWNDGFGKDNYNLLVAVETGTNKTVGHVATGYYKSIEGSEPLLTIGMFFVLPEYRGIGLGTRLFEKVLENPKFKGINWGLNGVPKMTKKYATKFGFDQYPEWQVGSFEAAIADIDLRRLESHSSIMQISFENVDFKKFVEYDTVMTDGIRRDEFIRRWLDSDNSFSNVALKNEKIVGICNIRVAANNILAIGPFYAETKTIAESLLKGVLKIVPNISKYSKICIFPTSTNCEAKKIFEKSAHGKILDHGVIYGQFTNRVIQVNPLKIYSITEHAMSYC